VAPGVSRSTGNEGGTVITCDVNNDDGRNKVQENRRGNSAARPHGLRQEGVDTGRHDEQHMGDSVPEGTQCPKRMTVSRRGTNLLWGRTGMLGRTCWANDKAEDGKRDVGKGDGMRRFWREPGEGDFTGGKMDIAS